MLVLVLLRETKRAIWESEVERKLEMLETTPVLGIIIIIIITIIVIIIIIIATTIIIIIITFLIKNVDLY